MSQTTTTRPRNVSLMYWSFIFGGILFFLPIVALYYEESLFSLTNVALIYSIEALGIVLFEVPSGALADLFGRKKTIVLGNIIAILGLIFLAIGGSMLMFIIFAVLTSFGRSMVSGADSAIIYDSLKEKGQEKKYEKTIGTFYAMWAIGATIGSLVGGHLAVSNLKLPIYLTFIPLIIATVFVLFLKEPVYKKERHKNVFKHMLGTAKFAFSIRNFALLLASAFVIFGFGENLLMMGALFLEFKQVPIEVIGYATAAVTALIALGEFYGHEIGLKIGRKRMLIIIGLGGPALFFIGTFMPLYLAALFYALPALLFGIRHTVINAMLNEGVDSSKRATMVSLWSFCGELGIVIGAPFIGWLADLYDINIAFRISAILLAGALVLYAFLRIKKIAISNSQV
ncbi:MFS transporter [Patescibacteria group bacterium]|nr:MFS transporter [Patescibacteria group bacterium]MBU0963525.1 MFS transporter [Patescibacteria group bacterium]